MVPSFCFFFFSGTLLVHDSSSSMTAASRFVFFTFPCCIDDPSCSIADDASIAVCFLFFFCTPLSSSTTVSICFLFFFFSWEKLSDMLTVFDGTIDGTLVALVWRMVYMVMLLLRCENHDWRRALLDVRVNITILERKKDESDIPADRRSSSVVD